MKKVKRIRFLLSKNKQARKALALVCFVLLMVGSILIGMKLLDDNGRVSAHPTNPITLMDEDGNNVFEVPIDASNLIEPALTSQGSLYADFVQTNSDLPTVIKGAVHTFWSEGLVVEGASSIRDISWAVKDVRLTEKGNYCVLLGASGYNTGGVFAFCIINPLGEIIYKSTRGNLRTVANRLETKFFGDVGGKEFLVGTLGNKFYRYTLSNETSTSVTVDESSVDVDTTNSPNTILGVGYTYVTESSLNNNERSTLSARVYFDSRDQYNANASLLFRVPIATISTDGWIDASTPSFSFNANHEYSLESFIPPEAENTTGNLYGAVTPSTSIITNDHVYGNFDYTAGSSGGISMKTIQVFDKNDTFYENGKPVKRRKVLYENRSTSAQIYLLNELCNEDVIYFVSTEIANSKLIKIDLKGSNAYVIQTLKTYPRNTILNFVENPDDPTQLFYFGSTGSLTGEFYHPVLTGELSGNRYYVQGITDRNFDRKSLYAIAMDSDILPDFMKQGDGKALIFGRTRSVNRAFIDNQYRVGEVGEFTEVDSLNPTNQAFIGSVESQSDFAPIVKAKNDIEVNISHEKIDSTEKNANGWTFLDNWLITGEKNGTLSSPNAVNVYDYMDSRDSNFGQSWLDKRINRNPKIPTADIDWLRLGFNKAKAGPQQVTYFVTDSQNQTSVKSRWANKKTSQTITDPDNKFALDAQNFHIALDDLESTFNVADADKVFKKLAKTTAWDLVNHGTGDGDYGEGLDEDGEESKFSGKVTVDTNQLNALKNATVAKPYPVDVTYTTGVSGITIKNRVWVFATTKNTVPNTETNPAVTAKDTNGVVYYADDYTIPYRLRKTQTNSIVLTTGNVKVYDYFDASNENSAELPTLADATKNANKLVVSLPTIHDALAPGKVTPSVTYKWDGYLDANHKDGSIAGNETIGHLDINLTGNVLFHVRQVVLNESGEIVVPTEGYFDIKNIKNNGGNPTVDPDYRANLTGKSGLLADEPAFTDIAVDTDQLTDLADQVQMSVVVPEFYNLLGYYQTTQLADANGASHENNSAYTSGPLQLSKNDLNQGEEFWVTFYIQPNVDGANQPKTPQPYSWDYEKNDLGKIKTK